MLLPHSSRAIVNRIPAARQPFHLFQTRRAAAMATAFRIQVPPSNTGLLEVKQTDEAAAKVTKLLQEDLEVRWNTQHSPL
ncbi:hypothetical protein HJFPF1_06732 [Paramyrothecium foliicola]|nr:hypothetical protein HJFPF1_06732 [Paramyrothecium foliicola]